MFFKLGTQISSLTPQIRTKKLLNRLPVFSKTYMSDKTPLYVNKLVNEKSPYLLQHKTNPVHWFVIKSSRYDSHLHDIGIRGEPKP